MTKAFERAHRARRRFSTEDMMALAGQGLTRDQVGERLGVTGSAIGARVRAEGLSWPSDPPPCDEDLFRRLWNCHTITCEEIAAHYGISRQAVAARAKSRGLPSRAHVRRKLCRDEEFREMYLAGVRLSDIAAHFGCKHRLSPQGMAKRLGLPRRKRSGTGKGEGGRSGWAGTITMAEFLQMRLARKMAEETRARR